MNGYYFDLLGQGVKDKGQTPDNKEKETTLKKEKISIDKGDSL